MYLYMLYLLLVLETAHLTETPKRGEKIIELHEECKNMTCPDNRRPKCVGFWQHHETQSELHIEILQQCYIDFLKCQYNQDPTYIGMEHCINQERIRSIKKMEAKRTSSAVGDSNTKANKLRTRADPTTTTRERYWASDMYIYKGVVSESSTTKTITPKQKPSNFWAIDMYQMAVLNRRKREFGNSFQANDDNVDLPVFLKTTRNRSIQYDNFKKNSSGFKLCRKNTRNTLLLHK